MRKIVVSSTFATLTAVSFVSISAADLSVLNAVQPLDPGLQVSLVREFAPVDCQSMTYAWGCDSQYLADTKYLVGVDAAGNHYSLSSQVDVPDTAQNTRAYILQRLSPSGQASDLAYLYVQRCRAGVQCVYQDFYYYRVNPVVDITNGQILIGVKAGFS